MRKNSSEVIKGDCLEVLKSIKSKSIDMIYLDPPFFTQHEQTLSNSKGKKYSFSDSWRTREEYLSYMEERLLEMHRVLKQDGSIFLHCDDSCNAYLRMILDKVFGSSNFQSEIIWTYRRWSNARKGLTPSHQTIYFYSKSSSFKFNKQYGEYSPTTNVDQILQNRVRNENGKTVYQLDSDGNAITTVEKKGVPLCDVWDIPFLNPKAKERIGYPTQKPIVLLERIVQISTDENDLVLDPFCGSGTTLVACKLLNRNSIGIDISEDAINLTESRLANPKKTESMLLSVGKEKYKTKSETELSILSLLDCNVVQRNKGIDGILKRHYKNTPVCVKIQKDNETLEESAALLIKAMKTKNGQKGILVRTHDDLLEYSDISPEIKVIDGFNYQIESFLDEMLSE